MGAKGAVRSDQGESHSRVSPICFCYAFAVIFVVTGEFLIGRSVLHGGGLHAAAGVALNGLAWPAYRQTRALRQENLILRMLEIPLTKAQTAQEAAKMSTKAFARHFHPEERPRSIAK